MPQLEKLVREFAELDPVEREELRLALSESICRDAPFSLAWSHGLPPQEYPAIVTTPSVCGRAARFVRTRIPVWVVERLRQLGVSETDILPSYRKLRASDLVQAWSYADRHRSEIDQAIRESEEE